jgi:hypothetical protein
LVVLEPLRPLRGNVQAVLTHPTGGISNCISYFFIPPVISAITFSLHICVTILGTFLSSLALCILVFPFTHSFQLTFSLLCPSTTHNPLCLCLMTVIYRLPRLYLSFLPPSLSPLLPHQPYLFSCSDPFQELMPSSLHSALLSFGCRAMAVPL